MDRKQTTQWIKDLQFEAQTDCIGKKSFSNYPDILTVAQTAALLSVCPNTVYKLIREKEISSRKIGTAIRIRKADLLRYMCGNQEKVD